MLPTVGGRLPILVRPITIRGRSITIRGKEVTFRGREVTFRGRAVTFRGRAVAFRGRAVGFRGIDYQLVCDGLRIAAKMLTLWSLWVGGLFTNLAHPTEM